MTLFWLLSRSSVRAAWHHMLARTRARLAALEPGIEVGRGRGGELAAMEAAQSARPVAKMRATHHVTRPHPGERTVGARDDELSLGVPLAFECVVVDQRGHQCHAPVADGQSGRPDRIECARGPHRSAFRAQASIAARMSSQWACMYTSLHTDRKS